MGLHNYAAASNANALELEKSLGSADVIALAAELKVMGFRAWLRWQDDNSGEIVDYVSATPALREKKVKWRNPDLRSKLILASIIHCLAAHALLHLLANHEYLLSAGGSYRDTTAIAGSAYWQLWGTEVPDWPESFSRICQSPFD